MSYRNASHCRCCKSTDLRPVVDLGNQPLANNFTKPGEPRQGFYPLKINYCGECGLAQLSAVVDRDLLYRHYAYTSSSSVTMQRHYDRLFKDIESETSGRKILEIGSNNGSLLKFAKQRGWEVQGIDPALNLAMVANADGIPTIANFFSHVAVANGGFIKNPSVMLARHVFAHIDDWQDFMAALQSLSSKDMLICIEIPYAVDMLHRTELDTAYHEHLSYVTVSPLVRLLKDFPFHIHRIVRTGIHGGAILVMLRHNDSDAMPHLSADEMLSEEKVTEQQWRDFDLLSYQKISKLKAMVADLTSKGKIVSGFGASAKMTVMLNACGFTKHQVQFVTDNSPLKPGCLVPGTDIPVIEEGEMLSMHPDVAICGAWNYSTEILEKMSKYRSRQGKFVFPAGADWVIV